MGASSLTKEEQAGIRIHICVPHPSLHIIPSSSLTSFLDFVDIHTRSELDLEERVDEDSSDEEDYGEDGIEEEERDDSVISALTK